MAIFKPWSREEAELHGYVHTCPWCGKGPYDTEGPCSDWCEDQLRLEGDRGIDPDDPHCGG
jgi:hypothetical protein